MKHSTAAGRCGKRGHWPIAHTFVAALVCVPGVLSGQTPPDSAALQARLKSAEALYRVLNAAAAPAPAPAWLDASDRLVVPRQVGTDIEWLLVDAARNELRVWPADSVRRAQTAAPPRPRRWSDAPEGFGIAIRDSAGRVVLSAGGEAQYRWGASPLSWSPDGERMLAMRFDERRVHTIPVIDYSTAVERVQMVPYPKSGTPLPRTEYYVLDPGAERITRVQMDTTEAYLWHVGWRPRSAEALVVRLSRDGRQLDLVAIDVATAAHRRILREERPESFVAGLDLTVAGPASLITPLPDGERFLWLSERDGWRHVYLYRFDGNLVRQVTSGTFPVHRVAFADPRSTAIYVTASADTARPYDQHVYRTSLEGRNWTRLTEAPGVHEPFFAPSGRFFVDRHSSVDRAPAVELRRVDGRLVRGLDQLDVSALRAAGYRPPEMFSARASDGQTRLFGALYKPADFDSSRSYPVVLYVYAGPFLSVLPKTYLPTLQQQMAATLAHMGYIVAMIDGRGTPGRGKAFQDATYGRIGQLEIPDQVAALRGAAAERPYMDMARVGVAGHSWGGYFALRAMLTAPDVFSVGYAGAPGELTELSLINEPYHGLLADRPREYEAASSVPLAAALRGRLKLMHGTSDVNAPLSTTMRMAQALIRADRTFDLLIMPGQGHSPAGAFGSYYRRDIRRYFAEHLPPAF